MSIWKKVFCTHEEKQILSTGEWLGDNFPGCALPSVRALRKWILIRYKDNQCCSQVMDVGPWCQDDDDYVFGSDIPRAEEFKGRLCPLRKGIEIPATLPDGTPCPRSNGAGLDIFPYTAKQLGIPIGENVYVEWCFV